MAVQEQEKAAKKLSVTISYNGMDEDFKYTPEQSAESIREKALNHFDIRGQERSETFLFGPDNQTELAGDKNMGSQVEPGSKLYLHRRTAGGG